MGARWTVREVKALSLIMEDHYEPGIHHFIERAGQALGRKKYGIRNFMYGHKHDRPALTDEENRKWVLQASDEEIAEKFYVVISNKRDDL